MTIARYAYEPDVPHTALGRLWAAAAGVFRQLGTWHHDRRTVLDAAHLPDALLRDIGLTRDGLGRLRRNLHTINGRRDQGGW